MLERLQKDASLVDRCQAGDERAMQVLFERHRQKVYAMALRLTGSVSDAEDVLQETFLKAWRSMGSFRKEASVGTWLCRIAINTSRDLQRRRQRAPVLSDPEAKLDVPDTGNRLALQAALRQLPEGYREVLVMHDVLGLDHREIAEVLEVQVGTSKSQLHKARARMRAILSPPPVIPAAGGAPSPAWQQEQQR